MIARTHRFHGYNSLRHVYSRGSVVRGQFCALKYLHNSKRSSYRVAVVVSRKVHKSAVVRNRIRRRMYEIVRLHVPADWPAYDLVFVVYSDQIASIDSNDLEKQIIAQLIKVDKLKTDPHHDILNQKEPNSHV